MKKALFATGTVAAMSLGGAASAVSVDITLQNFGNGSGNISDALTAQAQFDAFQLAYEDFEGFCSSEFPCSDGNGGTYFDTASPTGGPSSTALQTAVGSFRSILPEGSGSTEVPPDTHAIVRSISQDDETFGRYDADRDFADAGPDGTNNYLDSNDNTGIRLNVPGTSGNTFMFDRLSFLLTDVDDVSSIQFELSADTAWNSGSTSITPNVFVLADEGDPKPADGSVFLATLNFSDLVNGVQIDMTSDRGDGFGADSFSITAVPLPAAGWMLLAGIGAIGAVSRRKRKTEV